MKHVAYAGFSCIALALVYGCSGGGGSTPTPAPAPTSAPMDTQPPQLALSSAFTTLAAGSDLTLIASASDVVDGELTPSLSCDNGALLSNDVMTAPNVSVQTIITCTARASDMAGNEGEATLDIIVTPPGRAASDFDDARHLPLNNQIAVHMGQDPDTLAAFKSTVLDTDATYPRPSGVTVYTDLFGLGRTTRQFIQGIPYDIPATLSDFPNTDTAIAVGLAVADPPGCESIVLKSLAGDLTSVTQTQIDSHRDAADAFIQYFSDLDRPIFIRFGFEVDGVWNCHDQTYFKAAFRYFKARVDALGADNIAMVWQVAGWPNNEPGGAVLEAYRITNPDHFEDWYPGDDVVDWIGVSTFYGSTYLDWAWSCAPAVDEPPRNVQNRLLTFAAARDKPVFISESAPQGAQLDDLTISCVGSRMETTSNADFIWNSWFADWFGFIDANSTQIRAVHYINTNWQEQAMWECAPGATVGQANCTGGYWGDTRLEADATILSRFKSEISKPQYVQPVP